MSLSIKIKTIPSKEQRYLTCGDYWIDKEGVRHIRVSEMSDYSCSSEFLVALHELIEQELCRQRGIDENEITRFDKMFEDTRKEGDESEPGDQLDAPYYREHQFATKIEKMVAREMGVSWSEHNNVVSA